MVERSSWHASKNTARAHNSRAETKIERCHVCTDRTAINFSFNNSLESIQRSREKTNRIDHMVDVLFKLYSSCVFVLTKGTLGTPRKQFALPKLRLSKRIVGLWLLLIFEFRFEIPAIVRSLRISVKLSNKKIHYLLHWNSYFGRNFVFRSVTHRMTTNSKFVLYTRSIAQGTTSRITVRIRVDNRATVWR